MAPFISVEAEVSYKLGKKEATTFLFDVYAETASQLVSDPEALIALLDPVRERVLSTLGQFDECEADLRKLDWERRAWQRQQKQQDNLPAVDPRHFLPFKEVHRHRCS